MHAIVMAQVSGSTSLGLTHLALASLKLRLYEDYEGSIWIQHAANCWQHLQHRYEGQVQGRELHRLPARHLLQRDVPQICPLYDGQSLVHSDPLCYLRG